MSKKKMIGIFSTGFIVLSAFSLLSVSLMAFNDPQAVMNLVQVQLNNNDAYSSIRGVYGGVGLALFISLIYFAIKDKIKGLSFLGLLWGLYAISRLMTIFKEGALGDFGKQWLIIETSFCIIAIVLLLFNRPLSTRIKN